LDKSRPPIPWEQVCEAGIAVTPGASPVNTSTKGVKAVDSGNLGDFQKRLGKSAGKKVSIVLEENGEKERYTFTVPRDEVK
jgi:C-terminal processing protease CtpA/Prc